MFVATKRYEVEIEDQTLFGYCDFLKKNDGYYFKDTKRHALEFGPFSNYDTAEINAQIVLSKGAEHFEWLNIPEFITKEFLLRNNINSLLEEMSADKLGTALPNTN